MRKCKNCGKQIIVGDSRKIFCNKSCSAIYNNSKRKHTNETKLKISRSLGLARLDGRSKTPNEGKPPRVLMKGCVVCGNSFDAAKKPKQKACSAICKKEAYTRKLYNLKGKLGGYRRGSGRGKGGWYKGFYCDSSWELAYVIYCLDNTIDIKRNTSKLKYTFNDEEHFYIPDFLVSGILTEIKGYMTPQWLAKLKYNPSIVVLYRDDMKPILEYVESIYGKDFIKLYDR